MTSCGELKTMKRNVLLIPQMCLYSQKDFQQDVGHSSDLDQKSGHPVFRAASPLSRGTLRSKGGGKLSIHFCADGDTTETAPRTIISVNQLSIYGAASDVCEEYSTCQARTERPVLAGQSDPLFAPARLLMTTPRPSIEIPAQGILLERLSQQERVIKICTDAGFLKTVEVGQYFMTKHTDEFSQFTEPVTCREYTLPRDENSTDPKRLDSREHQTWTPC